MTLLRRWAAAGSALILATVGGVVVQVASAGPASAASAHATTISGGFTHSCMIRGGKGYCWGDNSTGQLGNGTTVSSTVPVPVYTGGVLAGVTLTQIVAASGFSCALSSAGAVYCWGVNIKGQLGNNGIATSSVPVAVYTGGVLSGLTITQISGGSSGQACALSSTGLAFCWGPNASGQLGNNSTSFSNVPVAVSTSGVLSGKTLTQISTSGGGSTTCALSSTGTAYCWGLGTSGQLGNNGFINSSVPVAVNTSGVLSGVTLTQISTGAFSACALSSAGAVYCWGSDSNGQLGNSSPTNSSVPVAVNTSGVLSGLTVTQISTGELAACALSSAGAVYCWGDNSTGELGNNSTTQSTVPVAVTTSGVLSGKTLTQITSGYLNVCVTDSTSAAYCWGQDTSGQDGNPLTSGNNLVAVPVQLNEGLAEAGQNHSCELRNGAAYCWGANSNGQLGNGGTISSNVPVPVYAGGVLSGVSLAAITAGTSFTCAISSAGAAYCWGLNSSGQLGNGSTTQSTVPVAVSTSGVLSGKVLTQIAAGSNSACALSSAGAVYCWGDDSTGELGNGTSSGTSTTPVAVTTTGTPIAGKLLTQVAAGNGFACVLSSTGLAYCWGSNANGQLGNGTTTSSSTAVSVSAALVFVDLTANQSTTCAVTNTALAYCWGLNSSGQIGNGSTTQSMVPVAVTTTGTPMAGKALIQITEAQSSTCALDTSGLAYCWGLDSSGQLGNNSTTQSLVPVTVTTSGVLSGQALGAISGGGSQVCALGTTGAAYCWGLNSSGQVGNPATGVNFPVPVTVDAAQPGMISAGNNTSCTLRGGQAYCWGSNNLGQLGNGTTIPSYVPVPVYTGGALSGVTLTQIAVGTQSVCALSSVGAVYCWGDDTSGELGNNNDVASSNVPVAVSTSGVLSGVTVTQISVGGLAACALGSTGAVYCWGKGTSGQLGNNSTANSGLPVAVSTSGVLSGKVVTQVAAGQFSACALASNGLPYCWGDDSTGELGDNNRGSQANTPVAVVSRGALAGTFLTEVAVGSSSACGMDITGLAYCWGSGGGGQLGNNSTAESDVPAAVTTSGVLSGQVLAQISVGTNFACGLDITGTGYCWGDNVSGDLGNNSTTQSNVPVTVTSGGFILYQIETGTSYSCVLTAVGQAGCWGLNSSGQLGNPATAKNSPVPTPVTSAATLIAAGVTHSCLLRNGKAFCWGDNTYGELGNAGNTTSRVPVAVSTSGALSGVTLMQISTGQGSTCALSATGTLYCWGRNAFGQLGNGNTTNSNVPVAVSSAVAFTQISVGDESTCALNSSGAAYCWGSGTQGVLGNGTTTSPQTTPVAVSTTGALSGVTLTQVNNGSLTACGLSNVGTDYCWGSGTNGQMGNGTTTTTNSSPVAVSTSGVLSGEVLNQAAAGFPDVCTMSADGAAYCWGLNVNGGLGNGTTTRATTPVAVSTSGALSGVQLTQIAANGSFGTTDDFSCGLSTAGAAYCWGYDADGELGNALNTQSTTPVAVSTAGVLSGVPLAQIAVGAFHACVLDTTGQAYCWGLNSSGQLGNNSTTSSNVPVAVGGLLPGAPTGVTATAGNAQAVIAWTAPASLGAGPLTGYTATAAGSTGTFTCSTTSATTCTITGLTNGVTYTVTVIAMTTAGNSAASSPVTVTPSGTLTLTSPGTLSWAVAVTGANLVTVDPTAAHQALTVADASGAGAGWHITVSASTFTNGTHTLPNSGALIFTGSLASQAATTAPTATCSGSCTLPTDTTTYPVPLTTAASSPTAYTVYDTAAGTGKNSMTLGGSTAANPIGWWIPVPASAFSGSYTSTLTITIVSGP